MPSQQCLANIKAEKPPSNIPCTEGLCTEMNVGLAEHCQTGGLAMDTPVISYDSTLKKTCYCCCSCYTLNTPIEATKGEFVLIQNINAGDSILTAGLDLNWEPGIVKDRSGAINISMVPGLYLVKYEMPGEEKPRDILVTPDHLFLMYSSKTLKKVQHLIPGNKLMTSDGNAASVTFVAHGEYETSIQSINMKEKFNGKNLTGHLLNANGIVSTDYAVQAYYETNNISDEFRFKFSDESEVYEVGSKEYIKQFQSPKLDAFLSTPDEWPKGFMPRREILVNVPAGAKSFITVKQAHDIFEHSEFNAYSNGAPRDAINKLFRIFSANNNSVNFILDWNNERVNAFAWMQGNQNYVLLTGGLARVKELYVDAFALIISDMLTRLSVEACVAEADYASFNTLRKIFPDSIYAQLAPEGITQVTKQLFDKIEKKHAGGNPDDVCDEPSIACRTEAFWNGLSLLVMPRCGVPLAQYFYLKKAYASFDLKTVNVVFDKPVDVASGESLINYSIEPGVEVTAVKVSNTEPGTVILDAKGLKPESKYILSVTNVTSINNQSLGEGAYLVIATF